MVSFSVTKESRERKRKTIFVIVKIQKMCNNYYYYNDCIET